MNNIEISDNTPLEKDNDGETIEVGQWYWVKDSKSKWDREIEDWGKKVEYEWLGCVMRLGSNYIKLESAAGGTIRIHENEIHERLRLEPDSSQVIAQEVLRYQGETKLLLNQVKEITARLGVSDKKSLTHGDSSGKDLAVLSSQDNVGDYKKSLIKAKEEQLPELFKEIEKANENLCEWMSAETLPLKAQTGGLDKTIDEIDNRIFNVSLYAGLTEDVAQCQDGKPAEFHDKLHIMQRKLFMDEECLLGYKHGGMEFKNITQFDSWLCEEDNLNRVMPFPRCIVAMQVRRSEKEREQDGKLSTSFINIELRELDKLTFLYIKNGEQLYRLNCDLEFKELIFPDKSTFDPDEPKMVEMFCNRVRNMMSVNEYEDRLAEHNKEMAAHDKWNKENPDGDWIDAPRIGHFSPSDWSPFDQTNLYYDECLKEVTDSIKLYNRIAVIIQGLFDRSGILHPHPKVVTWTPGGFMEAIELVYDGSACLYHGDAPDFEEYRAECNKSIDKNSVFIGQRDYWKRMEAIKECRRRDNDWRNSYEGRPTHYEPYGNPGCEYISKAVGWMPRARKATFEWERERLNYDYSSWDSQYIDTKITVPEESLFNVSAYKLGDYKQFFQDPRTRQQYLKWAPMLLAAEEYHAGNSEPQEPAK